MKNLIPALFDGSPLRGPMPWVGLLGLLSVPLSLASPLILGHAIDLLFVGSPRHGVDSSALAKTLGWLLLCYLAGGACAWTHGRMLSRLTQDCARRLRNCVQAKLMRVPVAYLEERARGDLLVRVTTDVDNVSAGLQQALGPLLTSLLTAIGGLALLLLISARLTLVAILTIPLSAVVAARIARRAQRHHAALAASTAELGVELEEIFVGHTLLELLDQRPQASAAFARRNAAHLDDAFATQLVSSSMAPAVNFVGDLGYIAQAVVGGVFVVMGHLSLGSLQAFIQYTRLLNQQLGQLAPPLGAIQAGLASAARLSELMAAPELPAEEPSAPRRRAAGELRFERVSFSYRPDEPLLQDLTLRVPAGETLAIVGPSGSGKTTLVNLLLRFHEIDAGRIELDGTDIRELPRSVLRSHFGVVLQDTWLFRGSIRDNIAYGKVGATEDEILSAARAAYVDRFVDRLPKGYDSHLDEYGGNLSAGERQLVAIARAFLADPPILILDEATSSLDSRTEALVQAGLTRLRQGRTSVVIAHRLSTIRNASSILVLDRGRVVEQGSHATLLAAGGLYALLNDPRSAA